VIEVEVDHDLADLVGGIRQLCHKGGSPIIKNDIPESLALIDIRLLLSRPLGGVIAAAVSSL
jgi:hypothetical protein